MSEQSGNDAVSPYARAAMKYRRRGWYPIPLNGKVPVADFTGRKGAYVSGADVQTFIDNPKTGYTNVGLRMEHSMVGIDVDAYQKADGTWKVGDRSIAEAETRWGKLPPTYTSTSRGPGKSGIQFYRVPEGVELAERSLPDVELVRWCHRTAVVWPSLHDKTGEIYRWYGPDGELFDGIPDPADIPELPGAWVEGLRKDRYPAGEMADPVTFSLTDGEPDAVVKSTLDKWLAALESGSRHDAMRDGQTALVWRAREGYSGVRTALTQFRCAFIDAVAGDRKGGRDTAIQEWNNALTGSLENVAHAEHELAGILDEADVVAANRKMLQATPEPAPPPALCTLDQAHVIFRRWLGEDYDTDALDAMLAAAAVERLSGDPLWLLLVSGPGNAKTETVQALDGIGAVVTSTLSSQAALLSATPKRQTAKDATGGLLRRLEPGGVLVIKDVTSILSMHRDGRAEVLAALREVHDGKWTRSVGSEGGRTLHWQGRVVVVGAVTTAWDTAHAVISSMGDRFLLVRMNSANRVMRTRAGRNAIRGTGDETTMRAELAEAVAGVLAGVDASRAIKPNEDEAETIVAAADLVTLARTGVEYDYRGDVMDAHAPEMPTRFAKELTQLVRGACAVGMDREDAMRLAVRCARDSMPPLRLEIIEDVAAHPMSTSSDVRKRISKPRSTVDRQLQALHYLGVLECFEEEFGMDGSKIRWRYRLAEGIDPTCLHFNHLGQAHLKTA
ncbi:bifunctional DNA primase/polymerase [Skermania sp. ID1734]|uniref:bifunctional DNA primase/polymerase n=1 Tax=Skermania sp. ID1734 TaxID=2597516 RepID=UPI00117F438B|nr:bifunctional DNA primase/polymerase [Skermania sp. ID1734]TSD95046.1 bifunctional DNA primase/polymerase [Skermania sp. ID1734]